MSELVSDFDGPMPRRQCLLLLASVPLAGLGRTGHAAPVRRVGCLLTGKRPDAWETDSIGYGGFITGMRALGYVEGRNLQIEWRFAETRLERLPALAAELVRMPVEVIVAGGTPAVTAARQATRTIPIVMTTVADPVGSGFIASFARPGGNITGMSNMAQEVGGKYLQLIQSVPPQAGRVAVMMVPANASHRRILESVRSAATLSGTELVVFEVRQYAQIETVMRDIAREQLRKLILLPDALFTQNARELARLASQLRIAAIAGFSGYAENGGLMHYSADWFEIYRGAAWYVDRLLRGARPAELPVRQPSAFHLTLNRQAAQELDIQLPPALLAFAKRMV